MTTEVNCILCIAYYSLFSIINKNLILENNVKKTFDLKSFEGRLAKPKVEIMGMSV